MYSQIFHIRHIQTQIYPISTQSPICPLKTCEHFWNVRKFDYTIIFNKWKFENFQKILMYNLPSSEEKLYKINIV